MFSPTVRHRRWNVGVEPVKWMPARSRSGSSTFDTARPSPCTRLMTPGGRPAASSSAIVQCADERLGRGRLPHHDVAHQRRRGGQVAADGGEVERGDRVDEALERTVVRAVPDALAVGHRLLAVDLAGEVHVEPQEVDQLAGGVDLGLDRRLGLAEHRRGVEGGAPRPGQQLGGLEEDGRAVVERQRAPARRGPLRGVEGLLRVGRGGALEDAEPVPVVERRADDGAAAAAHHLLAVDPVRQVDPLAPHLPEPLLEGGPLGAAGGVVQDRLVDGGGHSGDGVHAGHHALPRQVPGCAHDDCAVPGRLPLGRRHRRLPDRGRDRRGRPHRLDLGRAVPPSRGGAERRHRRGRVRPLPPGPAGRRADGRPRRRHVPLLHVVVPGAARRRRGEPARRRLLLAPGRRAAGEGHRAPG